MSSGHESPTSRQPRGRRELTATPEEIQRYAVGQVIRQFRRHRFPGRTQEEAARLAGVSRATLEGWELGNHLAPADEVHRLDLLLGCRGALVSYYRLQAGALGVVAEPLGLRIGRPADGHTAWRRLYLGSVAREYDEYFTRGVVGRLDVKIPQPAREVASGRLLPDLAAASELWKDGSPPVLVLGDYGMGKTYLSWRIVRRQAEMAAAGGAVPLRFPLRDFSNERWQREGETGDLVAQLLDHAQTLGFPPVSRLEFRALLERGDCVVVVDGLDELDQPPSAPWPQVLRPLLDLGPPLIVTSRGSYLVDGADVARFSVVRLLPWDAALWAIFARRAVSAQGGHIPADELIAAFDGKPVESLTSRPLWAVMLLELASEVVASPRIGLANLYQRFVQRAFERRPSAARMLTAVDFVELLEALAAGLAARHSPSEATLGEQEFVGLVHAHFGQPRREQMAAYLTQEVAENLLVNRTVDGRYNFGHRSLLDYFVASGIARRLVTGSGPPPETMERRLDEAQLGFLVGILLDDFVLRQLGLADRGAGFSAHRRMEQLLGSTEASAVVRANLLCLHIGLQQAQNHPPRVRAACLDGAPLAHVDLRGCEFEGVSARGADLSGADLRGTRFGAGCDLDGADLRGADLRGADLGLASTAGVLLTEPPAIVDDTTVLGPPDA